MASFVILVFASCGSDGVTGLPGQAKSIEDFADRLDQLRGQLQIPGMAAAIAKDGRVVWSKGFGVTDVNVGGAVLPTTSFHAASLTKALAATVIMKLVEQGAISLDDPVSKYGVTVTSTGVVRVRHLLSMTSENTPGETFRYNGDRFHLLGTVIQAASGRSFADLVSTWIIAPLDLRGTAPNVADANAFRFTGYDPSAFSANIAKPYALENGRVVPSTYPTSFGPAAGLISSAQDLASFSIALDDNSLLTPSSRSTMFAPATSSAGSPLAYALGWFSQKYNGVTVVWDYGYWTANSSLLIRVPERGLTFVVMANTEQLSQSYNLGAGDLLSSPLAQEFMNAFVFGDVKLH